MIDSDTDRIQRRSAFIGASILTPLIILSFILLITDGFRVNLFYPLLILVPIDIWMILIILKKVKTSSQFRKRTSPWVYIIMILLLATLEGWRKNNFFIGIASAVGGVIGVLVVLKFIHRSPKSNQLDTPTSHPYAMNMENTQTTNDQVSQPVAPALAPVIAPAPATMPSQIAEVPKSNLGMWSLILSIVAVLGTFLSGLFGLVGIISLVMGLKGLKTPGRGMAIAGIVLSIIAILILIIMFSIGFNEGYKEAIQGSS